MRVLLISSYFYPHQGGSQQYMEELYHNLMKIDSTVAVDVICYNTDKTKKVERYRGFTIYRIPCIQILPGQFALPNYFSLIWTIFKLSQKHSYNIVHSNTRFFDHSWWVPIVAKFLGSKAVLTDHCASHPIHPSQFLTFVIKLLDKFMTFITSRFYDLIMVTNNSTKDFVQSIGMNNPVVLYGGVDTEFFNPKKQDGIRLIPKIAKRFSDKEIVITFLGRMIETKGPHLLMESAKILVKQFHNIYFVFAGNGEMYKKLNNDVRLKNVYLTGSLNKKDVAKLLANTDIFVHPSIHHEGFPNAILEAGASGCAVIATDMGGTREIIEKGKTGILVVPDKDKLNKAIVELINNRKKMQNLGKNIRIKIVENYDWKKISCEFKNILNNLLDPLKKI